MKWLGLDVGGANIKWSDGRDKAFSREFPLWKNPDGLSEALRQILLQIPTGTGIAVTMTGELADCFETKTEGVLHILGAIEQAAGHRSVLVYLLEGRFARPAEVKEKPLSAAASNWHALARPVAQQIASLFPALIIDVGSTTTDIIPLVDSQSATIPGQTDTQRLRSGQLFYSGVGRTPVAAITRAVPYRGHFCPVAAELFATSADVYLLLNGQSPSTSTADGRPLTVTYAIDRLARMLCADRTEFTRHDAIMAARYIADCQFAQLQEALLKVTTSMPQRPRQVIVSGSGEDLATSLVRESLPAAEVIRIGSQLGSSISIAAPAYAVASLACQFGDKT